MRVLLVLAAALVSAAPVGSASRRAELFVTALDTRPGALAETDLELRLPASPASVTVYVPAGYTLADRRPGSLIGSVTVTTSARCTADLFVVGRGAWRAGAFTLAVSRDTLAFSPPAGATDVDLDLRSALVNPSTPSVLTWRALITPARGASFEVRSVVAVPQVLTLKYAGQRVSGRLLFAGKPRPGVNVHLAGATRDDFTDERELGVARTGADGRYSLDLEARGQLLVIAYVNFYVGSCADCLSQSIAPPPARILAIG